MSLIQGTEWERSKGIIATIERAYRRDETIGSMLDELLIEFSVAFAQAGNWEQAQNRASTIPEKEARFRAQVSIVSEMAYTGQREQARIAWDVAKAAYAMHTRVGQGGGMSMLASALAQAGHIE